MHYILCIFQQQSHPDLNLTGGAGAWYSQLTYHFGHLYSKQEFMAEVLFLVPIPVFQSHTPWEGAGDDTNIWDSVIYVRDSDWLLGSWSSWLLLWPSQGCCRHVGVQQWINGWNISLSCLPNKIKRNKKFNWTWPLSQDFLDINFLKANFFLFLKKHLFLLERHTYR